jgi:hypothetical protein
MRYWKNSVYFFTKVLKFLSEAHMKHVIESGKIVVFYLLVYILLIFFNDSFQKRT